MTLTRTFDYALLRDLVVRDPRLYDAMSDDFTPPIEEYIAPPPHGVYVLAEDAGELLGFFALLPRSAICWEIHTVMPLKGPAIAAMQALFDWVWENTICERIVTWVPVSNRIARRFGKRCGLVEFAVNPKSFRKGGVLQDQIWMGITRRK